MLVSSGSVIAQPKLNSRWQGRAFIAIEADTVPGGIIWKVDTAALRTWLQTEFPGGGASSYRTYIRPGNTTMVIDSNGALYTISTSIREEVQFTGVANFGNQATDSTNLQLDGNVYTTHSLPYAMYLDRISLRSAKPGVIIPTTFRTDLPPVGTDSAYVFRIGRKAAATSGSRGSLTVYKVAANSGLSAAATAGDFVDMFIFDEALLYPAAGTSVQILAQISLRKR